MQQINMIYSVQKQQEQNATYRFDIFSKDPPPQLNTTYPFDIFTKKTNTSKYNNTTFLFRIQ